MIPGTIEELSTYTGKDGNPAYIAVDDINKNKTIKKYVASLAKIHKYFGFLLLITAFIHGYIALGTIRLHSEFILWIWVFI